MLAKSLCLPAALLCALALSPMASAKPTLGAAAPLIDQGNLALAANKPTEALDFFESAAAAEPNNATPYLGIAKAYEQLGLHGRALRYYREVLTINPNDIEALQNQALGMIARGKIDKAQANLERLKKICVKGCPAITTVTTALSKAGPQSSYNVRKAKGRTS